MIPLAVIQSDGGGGGVVHVSTNQTALNLKTFYELTNPPAGAGAVVDIFIDSGVVINSTGAAAPSITTDIWAPGVVLNLINNSVNVTGAGGNGNGPNPGQDGGTALKVLHPLTLTNNGSLTGGGGGGAGTDQYANTFGTTYQAGGGGGRGNPPGLGHIVTGSDNNASGTDATAIAIGLGGNFGSDALQPPEGTYWGGDGGGLGSPGEDAGDTAQPGSFDNVGGAAGFSIDGFSLVTVLTLGTLVGPTNP